MREFPIMVGIAVLCSVVFLTSAAASGTSAEPRKRCTSVGSTTLAQGDEARVYRTRGGRIAGCLFSVGRAVYFDDLIAGVPTEPIGSVVGLDRDLAAMLARIGPDGLEPSYLGILIVDLRRETASDCAAGFDEVPDIEVSKRPSAVAWIGRERRRGRPPRYWVNLGDRVLDKSARISPQSLRIAGRRVYWTKAGSRRSAPVSSVGC